MHQSPMELLKKQKQPPPRRSSSSCFCCNSRLSVSSPDQYHPSSNNISSIAHTMVQEKLDQMIREEAMTISDQRRRQRRRRKGSTSRNNNTTRQLIVMIAMEKSSHDPKQDFRESMKEMILANRIYQPNHLRQLLNCFLSMNPSDFRGIILQVFHEVCYDIFLST